MAKRSKISSETERVARLIFNGKIKPGEVDQQSIRLVADELMKGVYTWLWFCQLERT